MCNYCQKIMKGGITRAKQHLMGKKGNVAPCQSVPQEVKDELWALEKNKKMKESESCQKIMEDVTFGSEDYTLEGDLSELEVETLETNERKKVATKKGLLTFFVNVRKQQLQKKKKDNLKQINIRESCDKEAIARVYQYIGRFWFQVGPSFNMIKLESFRDMVTTIGSFGPHFRPPSYHEIRVPLLQKNLRKMFVSDEWNSNKLSKEAKGRETCKPVLMPSFLRNGVYILKVMAPFVKVLRLVDGEKKPAMGYIYEAMDKAKEAIMKSFNNNETKYKAVNEEKGFTGLETKPLRVLNFYSTNRSIFNTLSFDFITQWWRLYGSSTPNLQQLAIKILSLTYSSSGCERNWSVFEQIHIKRRNRLDHKKLHDLVYVKYNQALMRRYNLKDEVDPISLNDIDECNE
uniref:HAT C-terminal dimerisation domain-containing protein n=1 Tax=Cajanus cajan TaxID=3821 RepID=A0A151RXU1_CAJCA|nr:hypothetical protein KK1_030985 [Cajanus cajan]